MKFKLMASRLGRTTNMNSPHCESKQPVIFFCLLVPASFFPITVLVREQAPPPSNNSDGSKKPTEESYFDNSHRAPSHTQKAFTRSFLHLTTREVEVQVEGNSHLFCTVATEPGFF